ncbi:hypothetical protein HanXRQr2_Chr01g0040421 [Helianthus annuus]|uniref:Uncharacterized protein n=1 Tax=Helianthus annuus TaxID=4232 RepID=A0A9K3JZS5_HELAN|nr:hypothetical protein HanXRQr2_Chr01g0040421 [Helianthus annuus]KAJ0958456.1 hypothetical protein HanPSC8_Chr01g0039191 [Helianthus annuus]
MSEVLEMVNQLIRVPSQATSLASPVAVAPKKVFVEGEKTNEGVHVHKSACLPRIRHSKLLKPCSKRWCCVSLH